MVPDTIPKEKKDKYNTKIPSKKKETNNGGIKCELLAL